MPQPHLYHGGQGCYKYPYLQQVRNGYGGMVQFNYDQDGRDGRRAITIAKIIPLI